MDSVTLELIENWKLSARAVGATAIRTAAARSHVIKRIMWNPFQVPAEVTPCLYAIDM
jgi:hypothetical protein